MAYTGFPISQETQLVKESEQGTAKPEPGARGAVHSQGVLSLGDMETWLLDWTPEGSFCPLPPGKKMGKSSRTPSSTLKLGVKGGATGPRGGGPSSRIGLQKGCPFMGPVEGGNGAWLLGSMAWAGQP